MVEMRWLLRKRKELPPDIRAMSNDPVYKVLQYRQAKLNEREDFFEWSEWMNVTTVVEGDE